MLAIDGDNCGYVQKSAADKLYGEVPAFLYNAHKEQNGISLDFEEKIFELIKKEYGFFVEIGPGDGVRTSRTCFLENHGWQGILIEPDIELCARCIINRPKSAVLNYNCIQDDLSEKHPENVNNKQSDSETVRINCRTLPSILDEFQVEGIDLLVLNTDEKQGLSILKGMDFSRCRIDNILIMQAQNNFLSYLGKAGYGPVELKNDNPYMNAVLFRLLKSNLNTAEENIIEHVNLEVLDRAWDIAARSNASYPGKYIAYYSLDMEGKRYPGERPWEERWKYIGRALREACGGDLNGKRVLELGCNLGLLSVWAAREGAACQGYEYEADILEGAKLTASAFGVSDRCRWSQADFNKKEVTDSIVGDFDICTCLSVMNWVRNKDNLIDFLSKQKMVIYEGHDNDQIESERLRKAGFSDIERVAVSERGRGVFLARKDSRTGKILTWDDFEIKYGLKGVQYKTPNVNIGDGNQVERVYFRKSEVWKVRLSTDKNPAKMASPYEEAKFLQILKDVPNVCRFKAYLETPSFTVLMLEYFPNIGTLDQITIPPEFYNKIEKQKHEVVKAVNERGILHNDILDKNFLVNSSYDICLIDFDQSQLISGLNDYDHGRYSKFSRPVVYHTAGDDKADNIKKLEAAWDIAARSNASSPGRYLAYYSLNVDGRFFHGEIPWADRWKEIEKPLIEACSGDFNGKKIIELGCNMGLVSIWAAKNGAQCHGYDKYGDIIEACKLNASVFGVSDKCKWDVIDFNNEVECQQISQDYDVCICLSLMKWVKEKQNLLGLLSRQKKLIYEGHDGNEVETNRLKGAGFSDIREIGISKRGRTIFLATMSRGARIRENNSDVLTRAWNIAARSNASYPGKYIAYYSLDIDGKHFPGERPWEERWKYIGKALREACGGDLKGKRIIELGCNLGLLSVWAAREGAFCSGYEYESDILEGARLLASSFGVSERCKWSQADFNKKEVTDSIDREYDICTCLSVMNWVRNKDNLIEFLSRQKKVIYEGHDKDQIETERLKKAGFCEIEKLAVSERGRGVFLAKNIERVERNKHLTSKFENNAKKNQQDIFMNISKKYPQKHNDLSQKEKIELSKFIISTDSVYAWLKRRMLHFIDPLLISIPNTYWLTVGDGYWGSAAHYLETKGLKVLSTDIDDDLLIEAKKNGYIQECKKENAESLSFEDEKFDFVLCQESLHHFPRPMLGLYEMLRVAKRCVVLIEPNDLGGNAWEKVGNYIYSFTEREIEKIAIALGLGELAFKGINYGFYGSNHGLYEKADDNLMFFREIKQKIAEKDILCESGKSRYDHLVTIIFKESPYSSIISSLKQGGFRIVELPTPFICSRCKETVYIKRSGKWKCSCGQEIEYDGYKAGKFNAAGSYSLLDNAVDLIENYNKQKVFD